MSLRVIPGSYPQGVRSSRRSGRADQPEDGSQPMLGSAGPRQDEGPYAVPGGPAVGVDGVPDHERRARPTPKAASAASKIAASGLTAPTWNDRTTVSKRSSRPTRASSGRTSWQIFDTAAVRPPGPAAPSASGRRRHTHARRRTGSRRARRRRPVRGFASGSRPIMATKSPGCAFGSRSRRLCGSSTLAVSHRWSRPAWSAGWSRTDVPGAGRPPPEDSEDPEDPEAGDHGLRLPPRGRPARSDRPATAALLPPATARWGPGRARSSAGRRALPRSGPTRLPSPGS